MQKRIFTLIAFCFILLSVCAGDKFTLVIDAGHGGHDSGACGSIYKEKNLTLRHALAFGRLVERNCPDVKVIYTRTTDKFLELWQRAEIANKNKADLFISVHINALPAGRIARGFQTYTLGSGHNTGSKGIIKNLEVAKRENSVILLEKDYKQTYHGFDPNSSESNIRFEILQDKNMERSVELAKMMQKNVCASTGRQDMGVHQDNLAVLRLTSMPACLLELGFISTPDEEAFMGSDEALDRYARGIYNAFVQYKNKYDLVGRRAPMIEVVKEQPAQKTNAEQQEKAKQESQKVTHRHAEQSVKQTTNSAKEGQKNTTAQHQPKQQSSTTSKNEPVFKVQILASSKPLSSNADVLKGLADVDSYNENNFYKYTVGASTDYNKIAQLRKSLTEKFPQAFIVAFKDGKRMDTNEAIRQYKANKTKK